MYRLGNFTAWPSNLPSSLTFLKNYSNPVTNEEKQLEEVTPSGLSNATALGRTLASYHSNLLNTTQNGNNATKFKIYTASADRDQGTARALATGLFGSSSRANASVDYVIVSESESAGSNSLTPHDSCDAFDAAAGSDQSGNFTELYTVPVRTRLEAIVPGFNWTAGDVEAMQMLCG